MRWRVAGRAITRVHDTHDPTCAPVLVNRAEDSSGGGVRACTITEPTECVAVKTRWKITQYVVYYETIVGDITYNQWVRETTRKKKRRFASILRKRQSRDRAWGRLSDTGTHVRCFSSLSEVVSHPWRTLRSWHIQRGIRSGFQRYGIALGQRVTCGSVPQEEEVLG